MVDLHRPAPTLRVDHDPLHLLPEEAGWDFCGLRVLSMDVDERRDLALNGDEGLLVPLSGSYSISVGNEPYEIARRGSVFDAIPDVCYVPPGVVFNIRCEQEGELAVATSRSTSRADPFRLTRSDVKVEIRGAGRGTRQINQLLGAEQPGPGRLIVVEVITPQGNWSSHPPHKHDEMNDREVPLEEIYYYRFSSPLAFGFHRTYTKDRIIDETACVADGDVFLVPRGYHGPCAAPPGYDMYYLNVMAGPAERAWRITTDPDHEWLWQIWDKEELDPRLSRD